jgi:O-methyltransferase
MNHVAGETKIRFVKIFELLLKKIIFFFLKIIFPELSSKSHDVVISRAFEAPWKTEQNFVSAYGIAKNYSLNDVNRLFSLWKICEQKTNDDGDVLEIGTWKGGSSLIISKALSEDTNKFFFDTFSGIPKIKGENDENYTGGEHSGASKDEVMKLLDDHHIKNFSVIQGIFTEKYLSKLNIKKIKFCHIDVDTYESTSQIFEAIKPCLFSSSVIVVDDYNIHKATGIKKFVGEVSTNDFVVINNYVGQAIIIKK